MRRNFLNFSGFCRALSAINPDIPPYIYKIEYESYTKLKSLDLPYFFDLSHFSSALKISPKQLLFYINHKNRAYVTFKLQKKKCGFRYISAPNKNLKEVQRWILDNILYKLEVSSYCHGFYPERSIVTNAEEHINQPLVLGIDLKDFFPSIKKNRVKGIFKTIGYTERVADFLSEICTYKWCLPQGAPTSPMLANLVAWNLDINLGRYCKRKKFTYTRYADDITISGNKQIPRYKTKIYRIIEEEGFIVNYDKTRLFDKGSSQKVTGLIVNDKVSIGRIRKKNLRAKIHNIIKNGPIYENRNNDPYFKERLMGDVGFAKMVDPAFGEYLDNQIKLINWGEYFTYIQPEQAEEQVIRSLRRTAKSIVISFDKLGFFHGVGQIPQSEWTDELLSFIDELKEKCREHKRKSCEECLIRQDNIEYDRCLKYILGKFIGSTCGPHYGLEIFDIGGHTEFEDGTVFAAFLLKSSDDTDSKNSLCVQFYDILPREELDVIGIVTNRDIDNQLFLRLRRMMRDNQNERMYCFIQKRELGRIVYTFRRME